MVYREGSFQ
jgi:ankyrin repeat protein